MEVLKILEKPQEIEWDYALCFDREPEFGAFVVAKKYFLVGGQNFYLIHFLRSPD